MLKLFRWQGLLGFIAVTGLLTLFWMFYASSLIKSTIESYGSDLVGAKVDVGDVQMSFDPLGIIIENLEITDVDQQVDAHGHRAQDECHQLPGQAGMAG